MNNRLFSSIIFLALIALPVLSACGSAHTVTVPEGDQGVEMGYGKIDKDNLTYSVSSLKPEENEISSYSNMYDYLRGRVPGVSVGPNNKIQIRGNNSINAGTEPLIIVDGTESDLDAINPRDVYSVDVLKDGSSSIYGVRGACGVIIITTKSAQYVNAQRAKAKKEEKERAKAERKAAREAKKK
ncbi:MAG: TonB-dependent receptor plug domain-containing protein [Bacteroidales bacterium]|nr:TonB-dependent receptor plug domain-containing protein [Bacteroidales bacterium]